MLEDAGYTRDAWAMPAVTVWGLSRQAGVFVGAMYEEYQLYGGSQPLRQPFVSRGNRVDRKSVSYAAVSTGRALPSTRCARRR